MKTLLILGAGKEQVAAITAAKARAIRTVILDMNPQAEGRAFADEFHLVSTRDRDAILKFIAGFPGRIDGVITIASDIPHMVSAAAEALGVRHIPVPVAELCVHKLRMKEALRDAGVNVPTFAKIGSLEDLNRFMARMAAWLLSSIKPVWTIPARGASCASTLDMDITAAFDYSRKFSYSGEVIAESFVTGLQISTEGLMLDNRFYCTGFADRNYSRLDDKVPFMVEDGGDIPSILDPASKRLVEAEFEKAVRALGIDWGLRPRAHMIFGTDRKAWLCDRDRRPASRAEISVTTRFPGPPAWISWTFWWTWRWEIPWIQRGSRPNAIWPRHSAISFPRPEQFVPSRASWPPRAGRISAKWISGYGPAMLSLPWKIIPPASVM